MAPNLRLSLTIFTIGFIIEAGVNAYDILTHSSKGTTGEVLFGIGVVATLLGAWWPAMRAGRVLRIVRSALAQQRLRPGQRLRFTGVHGPLRVPDTG